MQKISLLAWLSLTCGLALTACGCSKSPAPAPAAQNQYEIAVSGEPGIELNLVLVIKKKSNQLPELERTKIRVPFSQSFSGISACAWLETLPDGASGPQGSEVFAEFSRNSQAASTGHLELKNQNHKRITLGDL